MEEAAEEEREEMTSGSDADFAAGNSVIGWKGANFRNILTATVPPDRSPFDGLGLR